ncbi:hypothetical protein GIB67_040738, partial [Kingdonia uniflora]
QQRSQVPKFGNWENEEIPYTACFDKARKGKNGGKMLNPNDPQNDLINDTPAVHVPPSRTIGKHERRPSREDGDFGHSPARHGSERGVSSGGTPKRAGRQNGTYDRSVDQSPLHPHYQPRVGSRGNGVSSSSERRQSEPSHGLAPHTPGRSRLGPVNRGNDSPDNSAAVPKFGEWDENNPSSADGYTHIFNKVREEKQIGTAKPPVITRDTLYSYGRNQYKSGTTPKTCFCIPFGRK